MRRPFVAGNWKMNLNQAEAVKLVRELAEELKSNAVEVGVCPPFVYLTSVAGAIGDAEIRLGAQDVYFESNGAFTGEISCQMLQDVCCEYVILGHSERRHVIGETDQLIHRKLQAVINSGLKPILCVGETIEQRDAGRTEKVVQEQLAGGLGDLSAAQLGNLVIAYEPVWAIGTGRNATPDQAQDVHRFIRGWLTQKFGPQFAQSVRIQYGGSVKPSNAGELMAQTDIDGALVGGASLKAADFLGIIRATAQAKGL